MKVSPPPSSGSDYEDLLRRLSRLSVDKHTDPFAAIDWDAPEMQIALDDPRFELRPDDKLAKTDWYRSQLPEVRAQIPEAQRPHVVVAAAPAPRAQRPVHPGNDGRANVAARPHIVKTHGIPRPVLKEAYKNNPEAHEFLAQPLRKVTVLCAELRLMNPVARMLWRLKALQPDVAARGTA